MSAVKRARIVVSGTVQGVGFRYAARHWAVTLRLSGWVRNLPDGRVEAVVEGEEQALTDFIGRLKQGPSMARVDDLDIDWEPALGDLGDFQIVRFREP